MEEVSMKDSNAIISAAIAGLFALNALGVAGTAVAGEKKPEKCYGVVKAGKNDCQTSSHACAGQNKADGEAQSWIYLPQGTCEKIVGGSLKPKG
jgi:uncharacterized membrane protein